MFRSSNPVLKEELFSDAGTLSGGQTMTAQGAVTKSLVLLGLLVVAAGWVWQGVLPLLQAAGQGDAAAVFQGRGLVLPLALGGGLVGFILALVISFKPNWSAFLAPVYAVAQGLFIGALSAFVEFSYPGLVMQAVLLTFGVLFSMLVAYKTGMIRVTEKFRFGLMAAGGAIFLVYLVNMVMHVFGASLPFVSGGGFFGIAFSMFVVGIAALFLVMDFDFIERGAQAGAPKYMEWYGAFGLLVTLVWLYIELLNLLMKLRGRD